MTTINNVKVQLNNQQTPTVTTISYGSQSGLQSAIVANAAFVQANAAFAKANSSSNTANNSVSRSGDTMTGSLTINSNLNVSGQANVITRLNVGSPGFTILPNTIAQFTDSKPIYTQVNIQNINGQGSSDYVATADVGSDTAYYTDLGKSGSTNYFGTGFLPLDSYLVGQGNDGHVEGSNVVIAAITAGYGDIVFIQGGTQASNETARFKINQGLLIKTGVASTNNATGSLVVTGGVGVQGTVYSDGVYDQNIRIITIANAAYAAANAAFDQANTSILSNGAFAKANASFAQANAAFANANASFAQANAAFANANSSFAQANIATTNANAAFAQSNGAFAQANAAFNAANSSLSTTGGTLSGVLTITNTSSSAAANTGALQVYGGATLGGNVHVGQSGFFGNSYGSITFANPIVSALGNVNSFSQVVVQNLNSGNNASGDVVVTADNGSDNDTYIDLGINSSTYNQSAYNLTGLNDGYLYVAGNTITGGGNLVLSTTTGKDIIFGLNGNTTANEVARFKFNKGLVLYSQPITFADGTSQNTAAGPYAFSNASFANANSSFAQANAAFANANASFAQANASFANANASFAQANAAFSKANATPSGYSSNGIIFANTTGYLVNANASLAFTTSNNTLIASNITVPKLYLTTTTGITFSDGTTQTTAASGTGIDTTARANANAAFVQANAAFANANSAYAQANSALTIAINANSYAQTVISQANTWANTVGAQANNYANSTFVQLTSAAGQSVSGNVTFTSNVTINGNLTVQGSFTTITTANLAVSNTFIVINAGLANTVAPTSNSGIIINRGSATNAYIVYSETNKQFELSEGNGLYSDILTRADGANGDSVTASTDRSTTTPASSNIAAFIYTIANTAKYSSAAAFANANASFAQANAAFANANAAFLVANAATSGYSSNGIIFANSTGYLVNANASLAFTSSNNTLSVANISTPKLYLTTATGITFSDGTTQTTASGGAATDATARANANAAFAQANAAFANANASFAQANAAFANANASFAQANVATTNANAAFAQSNVATTNANAAFAQANGSFANANAAFANANASFAQANSGYAQANAAFTKANSGYTQANTATANADASFAQANVATTNANAAFAQANGSFAQANAAFANANASFAQANAAFIKANAATSGYAANGIIFANATGYLVNSNTSLAFTSANNTLIASNITVPTLYVTSTGITFSDGTTQTTAASGTGTDSYARSTANAAYTQANSAYVIASNAVITLTVGAGLSSNVSPGKGNVLITNAGVISLTPASTARLTTNNSTGNIQVDLATTGITSGTYAIPTSLQLDAYGRVLSITASSVIPVTSGGTNNATFTTGSLITSNGTAFVSLANVGSATTSSANGLYVPVITTDAYGRITSLTNTAITVSGGGGVSASGYSANGIIFANTTGYLVNSNASLAFTSSNNTLSVANITVPSLYVTSTGITFPDGTTQTTSASGSATDTFARSTANASFAQANAAFVVANAATSGYSANGIIFANTTGYLVNANTLLAYTSSNNTLLTANVRSNGTVTIANTTTSNTASIIFNATLNSLDFYFQ